MTQYWEPGTQYNYGDVVEYNGAEYKIIQPHRSQGDWTPDVTPALWGKMQSHHHGGGHHEQEKPQQQWQAPAPQQQQPQPTFNYGQQNQGQQSTTTITSEEKEKHWYDLSDERKKQLAIGGGLAAATGLLAGGYFAYKHHEKNEEEQKAEVFALQKWVNEARARTDQFYREGPRGPATWVFNQGKSIPRGAISTGREHSWTLYICRAYQDGGVQLGKASDVFKKGAVIGYKNDEIHLDTYEILLGDMNGLRWVETRGRLDVNSLGHKPVEGGFENDGTPLYVARALHKDAWHPGKCSVRLDGAFIPYDGGEKKIEEYQVLCYN